MNLAFSWSRGMPAGESSSATMPAAASTPACLMLPPNTLRAMRARWMKSALPASIDPTGAPRPFERQNITESTFSVTLLTGVPR